MILVFILGLLEVVGVVSIFPFMDMLARPDAISSNEWLTWIYERGGFKSPQNLLVTLGIAIIILLGLTNAFFILTTWVQYRFSWRVSHSISTRLLRKYLSKPYQFFLTTNSSDLKTYIIGEANTLTNGVLTPTIELISRGLVSLIIFGVLIYIDPWIALIMFTSLGGAYFLIFMSRKNYVKKIGEHRLEMNALRFRSISELMDGIKTITVYDVQELFHERFVYASSEFSNIQPNFNLILLVPKYVLEFLAFGGILGITLYLYIQSGDIQSAIPRLSLYALAGYRLLPALQRAFGSATNLRHHYPVLNKLHRDLSNQIPNTRPIDQSPLLPFQHQISFDKIAYRYENTNQPVIFDLNLQIEKGKVVAFVGATGSGKTTLIDLLVGLLHPSKGQILIDGIPLTEDNKKSWYKQIAYVPQEVFLFDETITNNITLKEAKETTDMEQVVNAAKLADLFQFVSSELPNEFDTIVGEKGVRLSGGQRQRVGLARALYRQPTVLVLDEATSALDNITEQGVIQSIRSLPDSMTVVIIAHRLSTVKHADCIYLMDQGKIIDQGTYESLINTNEQFRKMVDIS